MNVSRESVLGIVALLLFFGVIVENVIDSPAVYRGEIVTQTQVQTVVQEEPVLTGPAVTVAASVATEAPSSSASGDQRVNLNTADKAALMTLSGIGDVKADAILAYRAEHGAFYSVDELTKVSGIGVKTLEKIRPNITV